MCEPDVNIWKQIVVWYLQPSFREKSIDEKSYLDFTLGNLKYLFLDIELAHDDHSLSTGMTQDLCQLNLNSSLSPSNVNLDYGIQNSGLTQDLVNMDILHNLTKKPNSRPEPTLGLKLNSKLNSSLESNSELN